MQKNSKENQKSVLVVEDETPIARALEIKMKRENLLVTCVANGNDALSALREQNFSVMLLDLMIPEPDGFSILESLQNSDDLNRPNTIAVTSNLSQEEDRERVASLGAEKYFIKSNTSLNDLVAWVKDN